MIQNQNPLQRKRNQKSDKNKRKEDSKSQACGLGNPDSEDFAELDKMVNSLMEKSENYVSGQRKDGKRAFASICKLCGKEGNGVDIKRHIEANHLEGTSLPCNFCENIFRSRQETHKKKH